MSFTRRLAAALPAVGVTVFAALAFGGSPAAAAVQGADVAAKPVAMATTCARGDNCSYGDTMPTATPNTTLPTTGGSRGHGGYGGESPTPTPTPSASVDTVSPSPSPSPSMTSPTPSASVDTVPPGGVSPTTASPSATTPGGVSPAGTLPLTGAPAGAVVGLGALLVAAGAGAMWYSRRRRSA